MQSTIKQIAVCVVGIIYSDDRSRLYYTHTYIYYIYIHNIYFPSVSLLCIGVMEETIPWRGPLGDGPFNALFPCDMTL